MIPDLRETNIDGLDEKIDKCSPYDYIKSICQKKPLTEHQLDRFEKDYPMWVINRWLLGTVPTAIININNWGNIPKKFHYEYLYRTVKKMSYIPAMTLKAFSEEKDIKMISTFYKVDLEEAKHLSKYINKEELKEISKFYKNK